MSFYWAAGGTIGAETQAAGIRELARERSSWFVAVLWLTGVFKLVGAALALALTRTWSSAIVRRALLIAGWAAGIGMTLYGGVNLVVGVAVALLSAAGVVSAPKDRSGFWWHVLLWDPWWLAGGVAFLLAARGARRATALSTPLPRS